MEEIILNNVLVKYRITIKNNKNTYFRFKDDGHIEIYASKYQSKKEILKYMKKNETIFQRKTRFNKKTRITTLKDLRHINIFGKKYNLIIEHGNDNVKISNDELIITTMKNTIDHIDKLYIKYIKKSLLEEVYFIQDKHMNKVGFDISNIKFKTRFTESRYGSCNPHLRTINFNLHLVNYDKIYLEYVFLHEITHLVHKNHSYKFYDLLKSICNDYLIYKKELNILFNK